MAFLLAQITDTHIVGPDFDGEIYVDNNDRLRLAVERLMSESVLPDAVVLTGDLTDLGTDEEMDLLMKLLEPLTMPILPLPGNHDRRPSFRRWFDMPYQSDEHLSWVMEFPAFTLVGLDTLTDGQVGGNDEVDHAGVFDETRRAWLDDVLGSTIGRPTAIAMHHPPFVSGIGWMDVMGLRNHESFAEVVAKYPHVDRIFCGHLHRPITTVVGGALTTSGISTVHHVELDLQPNATVELVCDPPGYHLHTFADGRWTSHTRYFDIDNAPIRPSWV